MKNSYGMIDLVNQTACLYDTSGKLKVDFTRLVPWDFAKGRIEVFYEEEPVDSLSGERIERLCVNFYQDPYMFDRFQFKPRIQVLYQLKNQEAILNADNAVIFENSLTWVEWAKSFVWESPKKRVEPKPENQVLKPGGDVYYVREPLSLERLICCAFMELLKRVDLLLDNDFSKEDEDVKVSYALPATIIKTVILNIPLYPWLYCFGLCLLNCSLGNVAKFAVATALAYRIFSIIKLVYRIHLLPSKAY